jgi:hypothetical protein
MDKDFVVGSDSLETRKEDLDEVCINAIRMLSIDAVQQANSGHPGMPKWARPRWPTSCTVSAGRRLRPQAARDPLRALT